MPAAKIYLLATAIHLFFSFYYLFTGLKLSSIYENMPFKPNPILGNTPFLIFAAFTLINFYFWIFLKNFKNTAGAKKSYAYLAIVLFILPFLISYLSGIYKGILQRDEIQNITPSVQTKTYVNETYGFKLNYPVKFEIDEDNEQNDYYDKIATFSYQDSTVDIRAISEIDIYANAAVKMLAEREISDSGFKYSVDETVISGYKTAVTTINANDPNTKGGTHITYTIANLTENLFITLSFKNVNQNDTATFLSAFKYTD